MDYNASSYRNIEGDEFEATKIIILDNMDVVWKSEYRGSDSEGASGWN